MKLKVSSQSYHDSRTHNIPNRCLIRGTKVNRSNRTACITNIQNIKYINKMKILITLANILSLIDSPNDNTTQIRKLIIEAIKQSVELENK